MGGDGVAGRGYIWFDEDEEPMIRVCGAVEGDLDSGLRCRRSDPRILVSTMRYMIVNERLESFPFG